MFTLSSLQEKSEVFSAVQQECLSTSPRAFLPPAQFHAHIWCQPCQSDANARKCRMTGNCLAYPRDLAVVVLLEQTDSGSNACVLQHFEGDHCVTGEPPQGIEDLVVAARFILKHEACSLQRLF